MILSYDEVGEIVERLAASFPEEFYEGLSGGIQLEHEVKYNEAVPDVTAYIMGSYNRDNLGKYIVLYYGSFVETLRHSNRERWEKRIFEVIAHEFTHHMEHRANLHALDDKDERQIEEMRHMAARRRRRKQVRLRPIEETEEK